MTFEEACKLASIFSSADGGCSSCVYSQFARAKRIFPEIDWLAAAKTLVEDSIKAPEGTCWSSYISPEELIGDLKDAPG